MRQKMEEGEAVVITTVKNRPVSTDSKKRKRNKKTTEEMKKKKDTRRKKTKSSSTLPHPLPERVMRSEDILKGSTVSTGHSSGNNNILNYVCCNLRDETVAGDVKERKIVGSIVNIAAYFHLGLDGIDVEAVCAYGLASYNRKRFGAGTVRLFVNLPNNHYTNSYEKDMDLLLKNNGISSLDEYMAMVEKSKASPWEVLPKIRYPSQNLTGLLFDSGRIVLIGASNEYIARQGAALLVYMLHKKMKIAAQLSDFRVVNIVTTFYLGFEVDLETFAKEEGSLVNYAPGLFPAVIMPSPTRMTLLVNYTGNCILTGADSRESLRDFFMTHYPLICKYRKKTERELVAERKEEEQRMGKPFAPFITSDTTTPPHSLISQSPPVSDDGTGDSSQHPLRMMQELARKRGEMDEESFEKFSLNFIVQELCGLKENLVSSIERVSDSLDKQDGWGEGHDDRMIARTAEGILENYSHGGPGSAPVSVDLVSQTKDSRLSLQSSGGNSTQSQGRPSNYKKACHQLLNIIHSLDTTGTESAFSYYNEMVPTNDITAKPVVIDRTVGSFTPVAQSTSSSSFSVPQIPTLLNSEQYAKCVTTTKALETSHFMQDKIVSAAAKLSRK